MRKSYRRMTPPRFSTSRCVMWKQTPFSDGAAFHILNNKFRYCRIKQIISDVFSIRWQSPTVPVAAILNAHRCESQETWTKEGRWFITRCFKMTSMEPGHKNGEVQNVLPKAGLYIKIQGWLELIEQRSKVLPFVEYIVNIRINYTHLKQAFL